MDLEENKNKFWGYSATNKTAKIKLIRMKLNLKYWIRRKKQQNKTWKKNWQVLNFSSKKKHE